MARGKLTLQSHKERGHEVLLKTESRSGIMEHGIIQTITNAWYVCSCGESWTAYQRTFSEDGSDEIRYNQGD